MLVLLDTHVLIWTLQGDARAIGRRTRALLARAGQQDAARVSPLTLFEIAALTTAGRIRLTLPVDEWIREALADGRVRIAELTASVGTAAGLIPRAALADPIDRLLVSTARALGATFVTADARILDYAARNGHPRVHDAVR